MSSKSKRHSLRISPIRQARALALAEDLRSGDHRLTASTYRAFAGRGWTRTALETAVNDLVEGGIAVIEHDGDRILSVRLREEVER